MKDVLNRNLEKKILAKSMEKSLNELVKDFSSEIYELFFGGISDKIIPELNLKELKTIHVEFFKVS